MRFMPYAPARGRKALPYFAAALLTLAIAPREAAAQAGSFAFGTDSYTVAENAVVASLSVVRAGGTEGAVSVQLTTASGSAQAGADFESTSQILTWMDGDDQPQMVTVPIVADSVAEASETFTITLSEPLGGATLGSPSTTTVTITDDDVAGGPCEADAQTLCLNVDGRFQVRATFEAPDGASGAATTFDLAQRDSGIFYFFNVDNPEMLVKVLDGCGINDRFWVLFAATTDVQFTLTVTDTLTGLFKVYENPQGQRADSVIDIDAFPSCGISAGPPATPELATLPAAPAPLSYRAGVKGGCVNDDTTLCLNIDGRFRVTTTYSAPDGAAGNARAIHLSLRDGGLFYFFDPNNAEMLIKVLDGCSINQNHWVLFAGATDVQFTVTITDTQTGEVRVYQNPQGQLANAVIDIDAFPGSCSED